MNRRASALLCVLPSVLLLAFVVVREERALSAGREVDLAVDVSDHWDRWGPSLVDRLAIRRVPADRIALDSSRTEPADVVASLTLGADGIARVERVRDVKSPEGRGAPAPRLRGRLGSGWSRDGERWLTPRVIDSDRRIFDASALPRLRDARDVRVRARVLDDGRVLALDLIVDGVPYHP